MFGDGQPFSKRKECIPSISSFDKYLPSASLITILTLSIFYLRYQPLDNSFLFELFQTH